MDRDSTTLLLLALLVLGGTAVTRRSSEGAGEKAAERAAERDQAESTYGSPGTAAVDLIGRFFESRYPTDEDARLDTGAKYSWSDGHSSVKATLEAFAASDQDLAHSLPKLRDLRDLSRRKHFDVEFMIATVPDPIDSHVGWEIDPIIDAIQRAFEANRFVLDRFYFPWQGNTAKPADPAKFVFPIHWRYPGVILFRSATAVPAPEDLDVSKFRNPKLHVVLLVGETPTRGMHKTALARALDVIAAWKAPEEGTVGQRLHVRILGPNFSGSSMSLRYALEEWVSGASGIEEIKAYEWSSIEFQMVTGSAQDVRNKPTLQFKLPQPDQKAAGGWRARKEVSSTFHSTMVPAMAFNKCVFTNYLEHRNNVDRRQIALLVEGDTAFGEQVTKGASDNPQEPRRKAEGVAAASKPDEWAPEQQPIILQYPMQIGRVRAAYERDRALMPEENRAEQALPRSHLELRLKENPTANDLLPTFSPLTETSAAAVLEDMLADLGRSGIRYLGIIGTDPMDILFLARLAHRSCPDAQLFATQADLLFTHADYRIYTDGMLIFSPYPLFSKSQAWMPHAPQQRTRRQFSDSWAAAGTFNASCSLLAPDGMDQGVDYAFPFTRQSEVTKPPVWCLVVANGAFWPVECYPWDKDGSKLDTYNDAVDTLIQSNYVSQLQRIKERPAEIDAASWTKKLKTDAGELWKKESEQYSFDKRRGTDYLLPGKLPPSVGPKPLRAHLAELALGLDGFLGCVTLILSAFSVVNCGQYFAGIRPFRFGGPFVRWSLFYIPSERCPIAAQATCYRFYFFVLLWLVQVAVMSPLLAGTCFRIDWLHGLHPRHRCILAHELTAVFAITSVILIESLRIRSERLGKAANGGAGAPRWPILLGFLLAVPAACLLAWLCGLYSPWTCNSRGVMVVSLALLVGLLFVKGFPGLVRDIKWPWILAFSLIMLTICMLAWLWGLCSTWPAGLRDAVVVLIASALGLLFIEIGLTRVGARVDQIDAWLRHVILFLLFLALLFCLLISLCGVWPLWPYSLYGAGVAFVALLAGLLRVKGEKWQRYLTLVAAVVAIFLFDRAAIYYLGLEHQAKPEDEIRFAMDAIRLAMYTERAGNLASGVSPILPALCVFGGIAFVVICHLRRIRWLCWRPIESPIPASKLLELAVIKKQIDELSERLRHPPVAWFGWLPMLLVASVGSLVVFAWPRETFETQLFKWFVRVGLLTLLGVIAVTLFQTLAVFDCLRQLLYRLAWHPMSTAYRRVPGALKRKFRAQLFAAVPTDIESELSLQQWQYLKEEALEIVKTGKASPELFYLSWWMQQPIWIFQDDASLGALDKLLEAEAAIAAHSSKGQLSKDEEFTHREVIASWARTRSRALARWLETWWETRRERNPEPREKRVTPPKDPAEREDRLREKAEEFVAIQLALVVRSVLAHLKNYLSTSMAVVMLLLGMLNSYPFQPHRMLLIVGWAIGLFIIGTALWIFVVCNRDEALSRLSGLHPNKIDWDQQFILSVFTYGVVPVLVLLSMQFPEYGKYAYSPLEFVTKVLK